MKLWRVALFGLFLVSALVGIANGHVLSGIVWTVISSVLLIGEWVRHRAGPGGYYPIILFQAGLFALALVGVTVFLIVGAVLADTKDDRNGNIGMAVMVSPMALMACVAVVVGYRRVQRMSKESAEPRSKRDVYAHLEAQAEAQQPDDPQAPIRKRRTGIFLGIAAAGYVMGRVAQGVRESSPPAVSGILMIVGMLMMLGGLLAAGWASVWVFKERQEQARPDADAAPAAASPPTGAHSTERPPTDG